MSGLIGFLRGLAVVSITAGAGMYGRSSLKENKQKKQMLKEIIEIIDTLEQQVVYGKNTLTDALNEWKKQRNVNGMCMVGRLLERLEGGERYAVQTCWKETVDEYSSLLGAEEKKHLYAVVDCFSTQNPERTGELLHREKDYFLQELTELQAESMGKEKTVIRTCLLVGLFLCIALW